MTLKKLYWYIETGYLDADDVLKNILMNFMSTEQRRECLSKLAEEYNLKEKEN